MVDEGGIRTHAAADMLESRLLEIYDFGSLTFTHKYCLLNLRSVLQLPETCAIDHSATSPDPKITIVHGEIFGMISGENEAIMNISYLLQSRDFSLRELPHPIK